MNTKLLHLKNCGLLCLIVLAILFIANSAQAQKGSKLAEKLKVNTVKVQAYIQGIEHHGFAFITGEENKILTLATARHVVIDKQNNKADSIFIEFFAITGRFSGKFFNSHPVKDVAIVQVEKPRGFKWIEKCIDTDPEIGGRAYYIGKNQEWSVPTEVASGGIKKLDHLEDLIIVEELNIAPGTSGAPLLAKNGIIGVITEHKYQDDAKAVNLLVIENVATKNGRYPKNYQLRSSRFEMKPAFAIGIGTAGVASTYFGIQTMNKGKDLHDYYAENTNPSSTAYPYDGSLSRTELYSEANSKYKTGQALVIAGAITTGAVVWLLLNGNIKSSKKEFYSRISVAPSFMWVDNNRTPDFTGIRIAINL